MKQASLSFFACAWVVGSVFATPIFASDKFISVNYAQKTYHALDKVDFFVTVVNHPTNANLSIELKATLAKLPGAPASVTLTQLTPNTWLYSTDPLDRGEYVFDVAVFVKDSVQNLENQVDDVSTDLPVDVTESQSGALDVKSTLVLAMKHQVIIQNNDGGWDFETQDPDALRTRTDASPVNEFGVNALALADGYPQLYDFFYIPPLFKTAQYLDTLPVHRKTRLYAEDNLFLVRAEQLLGFTSYLTQASNSTTAEIEYGAAISILGIPDPTDDQVNAIPQTQINAVPLDQAAQGIFSRLQAFRTPNLIGFDLGTRIDGALAVGRSDWALALARKLQYDFDHSFDPNADYAFLLLANTISGLTPFGLPEFSASIERARALLLTDQLPSGQFADAIDPSDHTKNGSLEDQAFILVALSDLGTESAAMQKLLGYLIDTQLPSGRWDDYGYEEIESQSELISALSLVLSRGNVNASIARLPRARPMPAPLPKRARAFL